MTTMQRKYHDFRISPEVFQLAQKEHTEMREREKKNNPTTVDGTGNMSMDFTGSLAHNGTLEAIDFVCPSLGIYTLPRTPYLVPGMVGGDAFDFLSPNGRAADIKGNKIKKWNGEMSKWQRLKVYDHQYGRPMDDYVFCVVDEADFMLHIIGVISKPRFWKIAQPQPSTDGRADYHFVTPDQIPISLIDYLKWCKTSH